MSENITDFDPANNPIHALRLEFGDLDEYNFILSDQSYQYFIDTYGTSPRTLRRQLGSSLLAVYASEGYRQRVGQEEAYLGERYENYLDWLTKKIKDPFFSGNIPAVYVGGVARETVSEYENRMDLIDSVFYRGQHARRPEWLNKRITSRTSTIEVEEHKRYIIE